MSPERAGGPSTQTVETDSRTEKSEADQSTLAPTNDALTEPEHVFHDTTKPEADASPEAEVKAKRASSYLKELWSRPLVRRSTAAVALAATITTSVFIGSRIGGDDGPEQAVQQPPSTSQPELPNLEGNVPLTTTTAPYETTTMPEVRGPMHIEGAKRQEIPSDQLLDLPQKGADPAETMRNVCDTLGAAANSSDQGGFYRPELTKLLFHGHGPARDRMVALGQHMHDIRFDPRANEDTKKGFVHFDCTVQGVEKYTIYPGADVVEVEMEGMIVADDGELLYRDDPFTNYFILEEGEKTYPDGTTREGVVIRNIWEEHEKLPNQ